MSASSWISQELADAVVWVCAAVALYIVIRELSRPLQPMFVSMELASHIGAKRGLKKWQDAGMIRRALGVIALDVAFVLLYVRGAWLLTIATIESTHGVVMLTLAWLVLRAIWAAAIVNLLEDLGLLITLLGSKVREDVVVATRVLGWIKYTIFALTVVYVMFRVEVYLFGHLRTLVADHPRHTIGSLVAATVIVAFLVARRVVHLSRNHRPLLSLQLAPNQLAAKGVLERWGTTGRGNAKAALILESVLALLYGLALATICERLGFLDHWLWPQAGKPWIKVSAAYAAWLTLIAAACHLAQNLGAYVAVRTSTMGWWVGAMRYAGRLRLTLLSVVLVYFALILVSVESRLLVRLGEWLSGLRG